MCEMQCIKKLTVGFETDGMIRVVDSRETPISYLQRRECRLLSTRGPAAAEGRLGPLRTAPRTPRTVTAASGHIRFIYLFIV